LAIGEHHGADGSGGGGHGAVEAGQIERGSQGGADLNALPPTADLVTQLQQTQQRQQDMEERLATLTAERNAERAALQAEREARAGAERARKAPIEASLRELRDAEERLARLRAEHERAIGAALNRANADPVRAGHGVQAPFTASAGLSEGSVRVSMPTIDRWRVEQRHSRNAQLFLRDVETWCIHARQEAFVGLSAHLDDTLRPAFEAVRAQRVSAGLPLRWADAAEVFLHLLGRDLVDPGQDAALRITRDGVRQGKRGVVEYALEFRTLYMQAPFLPALVVCDKFVQGLRADLRSECGHPITGGVWLDFEQCITYATLRESVKRGVPAQPTPVSAGAAGTATAGSKKGRGRGAMPSQGQDGKRLCFQCGQPGHLVGKSGTSEIGI